MAKQVYYRLQILGMAVLPWAAPTPMSVLHCKNQKLKLWGDLNASALPTNNCKVKETRECLPTFSLHKGYGESVSLLKNLVVFVPALNKYSAGKPCVCEM